MLNLFNFTTYLFLLWYKTQFFTFVCISFWQKYHREDYIFVQYNVKFSDTMKYFSHETISVRFKLLFLTRYEGSRESKMCNDFFLWHVTVNHLTEIHWHWPVAMDFADTYFSIGFSGTSFLIEFRQCWPWFQVVSSWDRTDQPCTPLLRHSVT